MTGKGPCLLTIVASVSPPPPLTEGFLPNMNMDGPSQTSRYHLTTVSDPHCTPTTGTPKPSPRAGGSGSGPGPCLIMRAPEAKCRTKIILSLLSIPDCRYCHWTSLIAYRRRFGRWAAQALPSYLTVEKTYNRWCFFYKLKVCFAVVPPGLSLLLCFGVSGGPYFFFRGRSSDLEGWKKKSYSPSIPPSVSQLFFACGKCFPLFFALWKLNPLRAIVKKGPDADPARGRALPASPPSPSPSPPSPSPAWGGASRQTSQTP